MITIKFGVANPIFTIVAAMDCRHSHASLKKKKDKQTILSDIFSIYPNMTIIDYS